MSPRKSSSPKNAAADSPTDLVNARNIPAATGTGSLFEHRIIRASAGSGKTFQLSNRFLGLLCQGVPVETVLASTFTRKAAGEILDRVVLRLAIAANDPVEAGKLAKVLETPDLDQARCRTLLGELTRNLYRTRVGTLDSFFSQMATSFCLELGLSPGWRMIDEFEDKRLRTEAIEAVLRNDDNRQIRRITSLLSKGAASRSIAALLRTTVDSLYDVFQETGANPEPWHSLKRAKPLDAEALQELLGRLLAVDLPNARMVTARNGDVALAEEGDWESLLGKGLTKKVLEGDYKFYGKEIPSEAVALYEELLANAAAHLIGVVIFQTEATYELLARFHAEYQRLKADRQAWRYDDVTRRLAEATGLGGSAALAHRLDSQIDHLLLDEFQDTSPLQWRVLRPFGRRITGAGTHQSLGSFFCVGDIKQAIYGWRGGVAEIFDAVADELPGLTPLSLAVSWRSSPQVIEAVNQIFSRLDQHGNLDRFIDSVRGWQERMDRHSTQRDDLSGYVTLETAAEAEDDAVLDTAVDRICEVVANAPDYSIGVLVRSNSTIAQIIHRLQQRGIRASEEGGNPVTDSAAVLLCLSALQLADHPGDTVARFHLSQSPLGPVLGLPDSAGKAEARQASQQIRDQLLLRGYGGLLYDWAKELAPHCNRREVGRLEKLVEIGYEFQRQATLRPRDFLQFVEGKRVADPSADQVRVMTIHQSKGLEFDVVVLPELDASFPGQSDDFVVNRQTPTSPIDRVCRHTNAALQKLLPKAVQEMFAHAESRKASEALCVLYVATTRAVHALHMVIRPSKKSEKQLLRTAAGMLRAALTDGQFAEPSSLLFELGDPQWYASSTPTELPDVVAETTDEEPLVVTLNPAPSRPRGVVRKAAPSQHEGGQAVSLRSVLQGDDLWGLRRGQILHAWLDKISWLSAGPPDRETLFRIAKKIGAGPLSLPALMDEFEQMLQQPNLHKVLTLESYQPPRGLPLPAEVIDQLGENCTAETLREQRFAVREGEQIAEGVIDRLTLLRCDGKLLAADLVDFKTDSLRNHGDGQSLVEYYRPQMEAYRQAAAKTLNLDPRHVTARLLFTASDAIVNISQPLGPAARQRELF
ncbi:UvrD-helicase domain-containing protein [Lignipirellula cremea]|uniref:DNA 3'-5' helicase n=1 Tax=Lignipirellula cremea TaxID=2528010 RepID=A0A518DUW1_9BACT|nr:UvrD-helicase domain-containing protein [Lignipirellula cremea]QDU95617.1 Putative ATP-dependent DNA helicase YjcD [Lignipirellula cremea]